MYPSLWVFMMLFLHSIKKVAQLTVDYNKYCSYSVGDQPRTSYTLSKCGRCSATELQLQARRDTSLFSFPLFPASLRDARDETQGLENAKQGLCLGATISTGFTFLGHPIPFISSGEVPGNWTRSFLQTLPPPGELSEAAWWQARTPQLWSQDSPWEIHTVRQGTGLRSYCCPRESCDLWQVGLLQLQTGFWKGTEL